MRIGLLQCDHVSDVLIGIDGDYAEIFTRFLQRQDETIDVIIYDLTSGKFPTDLYACDGYVISGSRQSAYDEIPWIIKAKELVRNLYEKKIPVVGICFGHQLIAEALDGKVELAIDKGWGVGVHSWDIKEKQAWMGDTELPSLALHVSHQDQVTKMPTGGKLLVSSDFCPIAGYQVDEHILSFQGHPEFSREFCNALFSGRVDRIGEEVVKAGQESLKQGVHNDEVGAWMVNFIKKNKVMITLNDLDDLPNEMKIYDLLVHAPYFHYEQDEPDAAYSYDHKKETLQDIKSDTPYLKDDYTWAIPRENYIYFTNAHFEGRTLKISKVDYQNLFSVRGVEFYPEDEKQRSEGSATGMRFNKTYIESAKNIEWIDLNFKKDELLLLRDKRLERIVIEIEKHEKNTH